MRTEFAAGLLLLALAGAGRADDAPPDLAAPTKLAREAAEGLRTKGVPGFFDAAFADRPGFLNKNDRPAGEQAIGKLHEAAVARYGKPAGVELVRTETVGQSLVRFVYLERFERGALVWYMGFYRGDGGTWRWSFFNMGDQFGTEYRPLRAAAVDKDLLAMAQRAADGLKEDGVTKLLDALFTEGKSALPGDRRGAEPTFTTVRGNVAAKDGKPLGAVELLRVDAIGDSFVRFVYLEKRERGGPVWKFVLYRTPDGWKWQNADIGEVGSEFSAPK